MVNDCENLYNGRLCWLTAHHPNFDRERGLVVYVCAYPDNCKECKDYKSRNKHD